MLPFENFTAKKGIYGFYKIFFKVKNNKKVAPRISLFSINLQTKLKT